jgi:hypothetical protein
VPILPAVHTCARGFGLEQHYRINKLVELWGFSRRSVIRLVDQYMGKVPSLGRKRFRFGPIKRRYVCRSIPESIVQKIYKDLQGAR